MINVAFLEFLYLIVAYHRSISNEVVFVVKMGY